MVQVDLVGTSACRDWLASCIEALPMTIDANSPWLLQVIDDQLTLSHKEKCWKPFSLLEYHAQKARRKINSQDPLYRALKTPLKQGPCRVLDATAGWGMDAAYMVRCGAHVQSVEAHPLVYVMLQHHITYHHQGSTWQLAFGDSQTWFSTSDWQVIYLDPMFDDHRDALSPKPMQLLQSLSTRLVATHSLLDGAIHSSSKRLVVKQPKNSDLFSDSKQWQRVNGKSFTLGLLDLV